MWVWGAWSFGTGAAGSEEDSAVKIGGRAQCRTPFSSIIHWELNFAPKMQSLLSCEVTLTSCRWLWGPVRQANFLSSWPGFTSLEGFKKIYKGLEWWC